MHHSPHVRSSPGLRFDLVSLSPGPGSPVGGRPEGGSSGTRRPSSTRMVISHSFISQNFESRAATPGTIDDLLFKMPSETSNIPGAGPIFPDRTSEHWLCGLLPRLQSGARDPGCTSASHREARKPPARGAKKDTSTGKIRHLCRRAGTKGCLTTAYSLDGCLFTGESLECCLLTGASSAASASISSWKGSRESPLPGQRVPLVRK